VSAALADQANLKINNNIRTVLLNASGGQMIVIGSSNVVLRNEKYQIHTTILVVSDVNQGMLVSWHDLKSLGVIPRSFPSCFATSTQAVLIKQTLCKDYPTVFQDKLDSKPMNVGNMTIHLKDKVIPFRISTPRQIPLRFQGAADCCISDLMNAEILAKCDDPTEWCAPGFFVPKPDGKRVRLVTDYTKLNKFVRRPTHPFPSVKEIFRCIPKESARVFAKLDAVHGYFQLALDEESSKLTTFLLPSGRYRYLRAPMGLSSSSDEWCRHSDRAIEGMPWARKIVDDILVWAPDYPSLLDRVRQICEKCVDLHITLSQSKLAIGEELPFAGCIVTPEGIRPDPARIEALTKFPRPKDITGVRSFLGLASCKPAFLLCARLCPHGV